VVVMVTTSLSPNVSLVIALLPEGCQLMS
jgi:hypothetical protein